MEDKLIKRTALHSVIFLIVIIIISIPITGKNNILADSTDDNKLESLEEPGSNNHDIKNNQITIHMEDVLYTSVDELEQVLGDNYIAIPMNSSYSKVSFEELYMNKSIRITMKGLKDQAINPHALYRVFDGETYSNSSLLEEHDLIYTYITTSHQEGALPVSYVTQVEAEEETEVKDPLVQYQIQYVLDEKGGYSGIIELQLNQIYASSLIETKDYVYISLQKPKDVYDKIVVIDAGHGGKDPGTHSLDERYYEKDVNLKVMLYLKELLDKEDIKVYYTRLNDETVFLNPRVNFANEVEADLFLSIHCNASESPKAYGSEVLYNDNDIRDGLNSKEFADIALRNILDVTKRVNRGLVKGSDMVIVKNSNMPIALIELGFMTNTEDLNFLLNENNQKLLAKAIHKTIMAGYSQLD